MSHSLSPSLPFFSLLLSLPSLSLCYSTSFPVPFCLCRSLPFSFFLLLFFCVFVSSLVCTVFSLCFSCQMFVADGVESLRNKTGNIISLHWVFIVSYHVKWIHVLFFFSMLRDLQKNRPGDPDYDPRTLFVPEAFLKSQTPVSKPWTSLTKAVKCLISRGVAACFAANFSDLSVQDWLMPVSHCSGTCWGVEVLSLSMVHRAFPHCSFPDSFVLMTWLGLCLLCSSISRRDSGCCWRT